MRARPRMPGLVFLIALTAPLFTWAADSPVVGQWKLTVQTPNGVNHPVLTIRATESGYAGSYAGPRGTFELADIRVDGATFAFPLTLEMPIGAVELKYRGTVTGDAINGVVGNPRGEIPFSGERIPAD